MRLIKSLLGIIILVGSAFFLYQNQVINPEDITIWLYYDKEVTLKLPVIMAMAFLIGAIIGFHANSQGGDYYALESSFLFGVNPDSGLPTYTLNRMGTNQGGSTFSFVFEGATTIDSKKFLTKYGKASK